MFSFSEGAIWLGFHYQLQQLGWYSFQLVSLSVCVIQTKCGPGASTLADSLPKTKLGLQQLLIFMTSRSVHVRSEVKQQWKVFMFFQNYVNRKKPDHSV